MNKKKIINDPVHGFININNDIIFDIIEHPWFQRMRRIKQLGLTNFVYPAANHTRFQHALGTYFLMNEAIAVIRSKGHIITDEEAEGASIAALLHDIGHGPFSHALENSIIENLSHEKISLLFIEELEKLFPGKLTTAIAIFTNQYPKKFLHQLIASQLDMDRLDYLKRDSFFTGVSEGVIGSERIIKMLTIQDDNLVIEAKGIYSIEKFLIARRLMYWQVYLHKTVLAAEYLLIKILKRAKELSIQGKTLFATPSLNYFLQHNITEKDILNPDSKNRKKILTEFADLDDHDLMTAIKIWTNNEDTVLSLLCKKFINRTLLKIEISNQEFSPDYIQSIEEKYQKTYSLTKEQTAYFIFTGDISNNPYSLQDEKIHILYNNGKLIDISEASEILDINSLTKTTKKYFLCYPKK